MYFLTFTCNTGDIELYDPQRLYFHYTPCSLGSLSGNTALGTVFFYTLPWVNIKNTSSRGNDAIDCEVIDAQRKHSEWPYNAALSRDALGNASPWTVKFPSGRDFVPLGPALGKSLGPRGVYFSVHPLILLHILNTRSFILWLNHKPRKNLERIK